MEKREVYFTRSSSHTKPETRVIRLGEQRNKKPLLPDITLADLPPANTTRWVTRRKAQVVAAVRKGILSLDEACARYTLSVEEFLNWQELIDRHGMRALRATRVKEYRKKSKNKSDNHHATAARTTLRDHWR